MILDTDDTRSLLSDSTHGRTLIGSDRQRQVITHVRVLNVGNIRVGDQSFDARFDLECHWHVFDTVEMERAYEVHQSNLDGDSGKALAWDPGLAFPSAISYETVGTRTILTQAADKNSVSPGLEFGSHSSPDTTAGSSRGSSTSSTDANDSTGMLGTVGFRLKIGGTFKCSQDLRDFPFDKQALQVVIQMGVEAHSGRQLTAHDAYFDQNRRHPNILLAQADAEYDFRPVRYRLSSSGPLEFKTRGMTISRYAFTIPIERDPNQQFSTSLVVLVFSAMSLSAFAIPSDTVADRLGVPLNLLLVLVAFKFSLSTSLPSVPYSTLLDQYMYAVGAFALACFVVSGGNALLGASPASDALSAAALLAGLAAVNLHFWQLAQAAQRKGSAKVGAMGKIDDVMVQLLRDNGVMLNVYGSIEETHLDRYRGLLHSWK